MVTLVSSSGFSYGKKELIDNQDSVLFPFRVQDSYVFAIADGVGSYGGAAAASQIVIDYISKIRNTDELDLEQVFSELKDLVINLENQSEKYSSAATTLTFGILSEHGLRVGHVGDCRLYLKNNRTLKQITKDHTLHQQLLDEGVYTKRELSKKGGKNVLSSAISNGIDLTFEDFFISREYLVDSNDLFYIYVMSDGAHHFWNESPRFSESTMKSTSAFSNSLYKRIVRKGVIDDYSLLAMCFFMGEC